MTLKFLKNMLGIPAKTKALILCCMAKPSTIFHFISTIKATCTYSYW